MPDAFWLDQYRLKAGLADPIAQSGRGSAFESVQLLHVVRQMLALLQLRDGDTLVDVGAACGLITIPLSGLCRRTIAIEPVEALRARLTANVAGLENVDVRCGHASNLPIESNSCERVLLLEVAQLIAQRELRDACAELARVVRRPGRVVMASVPDAAARDAFLGNYLAGVDAAAHLLPEQKRTIRERNLACHWHSRRTLGEIWHSLDGECEFHTLPSHDPHSGHRFHLVVTLSE